LFSALSVNQPGAWGNSYNVRIKMIVQIVILSFLFFFYTIYFVKMILLKKQGISADLLGKGGKPEYFIFLVRLERKCSALTAQNECARRGELVQPRR